MTAKDLFLFLFLFPFFLSAQIGLHPPRLDWRQLTVNNTRILYPAGYEARAQRVASLIDRMDAAHTRSVGEQSYNLDLVLQTENLTVNGYVGLAPFRSEFYTTGPQGLGLLSSTDWMDLLTVHEYRHVLQNSNERRGLTRAAYFLQGQLGWAALSGIATPNWFSEGDAVIFETALTPQGRGRTPAFSSDLRALVENDIVYDYAVARNGSFRRLVPDHYRYGYAMLTKVREEYGNDAWKSVFQEAAAYRGLFYPFSQALKRKTGMGTRALYAATMEDLRVRADSARAARGPLLEGEPIGPDRAGIWNYRFLSVTQTGKLYALRNGFQRLPEVIEIDRETGAETVITNVGIQREPWLDVSDRYAVWPELRQDPRYTNEKFSELILFDLETGKKRKLTEGGHYLSASLSPDGRRVAAIAFDAMKGYPELVILNVNDGEGDFAGTQVQSIRLSGTSAAWPRWTPEGNAIRYLDQDFSGVAIREISLSDEQSRTLLERRAAPIDMLNVGKNGWTVFSSGVGGVDNVYLINPLGNTLHRLTNAAIGTYYPAVTDDFRLFYCAQTPTGLRPRRLRLDPQREGLPLRTGTPSYFERPAAWRAEVEDLSNEIELKEYDTSNFSNTLGGIKLHSWSYNGSYVNPGLELAATNALNTVELSAGLAYNINEDRYAYGGTVSYGGLFPVVSLSVQRRDRNTIRQTTDRDTFSLRGQEFNQITVVPEVSLPLTWVAGNYRTALRPAVALNRVDLVDQGVGGSFTGLGLGLTFSTLRRTAVQQVQPRLGLTSILRYNVGRGNGRFLSRNAVYLPGAFPTHGIRIDADFQAEQAENAYQYPDLFRYARGYSAPLNDRVFRLGANYQLPVLYPEIGLLGITYFKRVRLNAFYDYSRFTIDDFFRQELTLTESSVGGELFFDNTWLNAQDLSFGVQFAYLLDPDPFSVSTNRLRVELLVAGSF